MPLASSGDFVFALLPFLLLLGFWLFLMRYMRGRTPQTQVQEQVVAKLEEIRQELERVRRAIEAK